MMLSVTMTIQHWMIRRLVNTELEEVQEEGESVMGELNLEALQNLRLFVPF